MCRRIWAFSNLGLCLRKWNPMLSNHYNHRCRRNYTFSKLGCCLRKCTSMFNNHYTHRRGRNHTFSKEGFRSRKWNPMLNDHYKHRCGRIHTFQNLVLANANGIWLPITVINISADEFALFSKQGSGLRKWNPMINNHYDRRRWRIHTFFKTRFLPTQMKSDAQ